MLALMADTRNEKLYRWRQNQRITQQEAADKLGVTRSHYTKMETGVQGIPEKTMDELKKLGYESLQNFDIGLKRASLLFGDMAKIKVVGTVSAGPGDTSVDYVEDDAWVPMSLQKLGGIGYVVDGESMMPALQPGDVAIFREVRQPYANYTFLVKNDQGEYRCKNIEWKNNRWTLVSLNPEYPDEPLNSWQILGLLIGWYRNRGKYEKLEADPDGLRLDQPI